jgi:anti-sigma B factor antagonist
VIEQQISHDIIIFGSRSGFQIYAKSGGSPMEVTTTQYKNSDLVSASGRIDSFTAPKLAEAMEAVTRAGRYRIVFDMSGVEYMSSAGLRVLISTQKEARRYNRGEVVLARVPKRIYEALELAGFVPLFKFFDDVTAAVGNF